MDTPRRVTSVAHGVVLEVTFWLIFTATTTMCMPVQTVDEILQSVGSEDGALKAEPQTIYAFPHNAWNLHIVENEMEHVDRNPRLYVVLDDDDLGHTNSTSTPGPENKREVDPWSLVWYMASFGGLVTFFLVVSCSECCCSKRATRTPRSVSTTRPVELPPEVTQWVDETPPPPYHLFAPPSYDTLFYGSVSEDKMKCEIYVVPVHNHMVTLQRAASSMPPEPT